MSSLRMASENEAAQLLNEIEYFNYGTGATTTTAQGGAGSTTDTDNGADDDTATGRAPTNEDGGNDTLPETSENIESRGTMIEILTRRLRCLFSTITWPIVPLGTLVSVCLLWVLYSAFVVDVKSSCSHPLHAYALASLCFLIYAPYHAQIRSFIFRYSRERDGPIRPTRVRLYDQLFHTLCILYVYGGVTVLQSCQQDFDKGATEGLELPTTTVIPTNGTEHTINTCEATCPHLFAAMNVYVTMLELFTLSLILPLLFLPCIYLWILRRASTATETFFREGDLFGRGSGASHGGTTVQELMDSLGHVRLVRSNQDSDNILLQHKRDGKVESVDNIGKECCICMSDFDITESNDEETGVTLDEGAESVVRTKCGHMFHAKCLSSWVGGRWSVQSAERRRTQRTECPLCREDLRPSQRRSQSDPNISTIL